ncbi:DNA-binding SARP family transcriptional activator [Murinocardiopsis flavida]|uniref:DNA-binding SARP family transcriptional activator n=1 Tax=Murinocardiopsis flavida TaxID=645275 RepID=A0A2P8CY78_9ACTN|nr:tetratricopeptide repeat protein [Murinocardiopsis flavida]PSK89897.1 DNA-binding SARP family transcriptional activator [Murinocardiopsis flavida]
MQICVLGSIEATVDGRRVAAPHKSMVLLVSLALAGGRPVSPETLGERLWDGDPGSTWRSVLHTYITRLRRSLEAAGYSRTRLSQSTAGYMLDVAPDDVDWLRFSALRSRAAAQLRGGEVHSAVEILGEALRLWRGEPMPGFPERWADDLRTTMQRAHQAALAAWAREAPRLHPLEDVADRLSEAAGLYPLNEALAVHLMRALHGAGRSADALETYNRIRHRLVEETGADPHPDLLKAHQEIMRGQNAHAPSTEKPVHPPEHDVSAPGVPITSNLPRDIADFADRSADIERIHRTLDPAEGAAAARVCVLSGMPGVGKTSLAVHAAHQLGTSFPDGSLIVELHGHHEHHRPLSTEQALGQLIQLAGLPPPAPGDSVEQRVASWRDHTARRRLLLVLDDAADAEQVVSLLPSGSRCAVIITSRRHLRELDGAEHLRVAVPEPEDAARVFTAIAAPGRSLRTAAHIAEIVQLCGQLPLAMRLIATRLDLRPTWGATEVLTRLRAAADKVGEFRSGQRHLDAAFAVSLRSLSSPARAALLHLGLHPAPVIDRHIAAAMLGRSPEEADLVLEELIGASLLDTGPDMTYRLHSLVQSFALRAARSEVPPIEQHSLRTRMLDAYTDICARADAVLYPYRLRLDREPAGGAEVALPNMETKDAAARWLTTRLPTVLLIIDHAVDNGHPHHAARLTHVLAEHLDAHGPWEAAVGLHRRALEIRRGGQCRRATAQATYELARALLHAGSIDEADRCIHTAAQLWGDLGDLVGQAWVLDQQGVTASVAGAYARAIDLHRKAQALFEQGLHRFGIALSLDRRGLCHLRTGAFHEAIAAHSDALRHHTLLGDPDTAITAKIHLAGAYHGLGYHRESTALSLEALKGVRALGDRRREGIIMTNLGEIASYRERNEQAFSHFHAALDIHREVHDPWTEAVTLSNLGRVHLKFGQLAEATQCFDDSQRLCATYVNPGISVETLLGLGEVEMTNGRTEAAHALFARAHDEADLAGLRHERGKALTALGRVLLDTGSPDDARLRWELAEQVFTELSAPEADSVRIMLDMLHEA